MPEAYGAPLILLENVLALVEDDNTHGLYSKLLQHAAALGYTLVQRWKLEDSKCGGFTQRARVFLVWEKAAANAQLSLWQGPVPAIPVTLQQKIASVLLPVDALPASVWLHSSRVQFDPETPIKRHKATKVGYMLRKPHLACACFSFTHHRPLKSAF